MGRRREGRENEEEGKKRVRKEDRGWKGKRKEGKEKEWRS